MRVYHVSNPVHDNCAHLINVISLVFVETVMVRCMKVCMSPSRKDERQQSKSGKRKVKGVLSWSLSVLAVVIWHV